MSVRKAHNSGRNHLRNVVEYYQRTWRLGDSLRPIDGTLANQSRAEIGHEKAQSVIDSITSSYADAGQAGQNPMLQQGGMIGPMPGGFPAGGPGRPPFPFPGTLSFLSHMKLAAN